MKPSSKLFVVANGAKAAVREGLESSLSWLRSRGDVVGVELDGKTDLSKVDADAILVLGGDGTLLAVARRLGGRQIPVMGFNFGRLGFLASFQPAEMRQQVEALLAGKLPVRPRMMLEASVLASGADCDLADCADVAARRRFVATALNDAVVTAGEPFHMVELEISADTGSGVKYFGDGVIVSTPSGSTAYNVSAGGPIIGSNVDAMCITPICPHSLSFRPVVVAPESTVVVRAARVNAGTTLFCDGQANTRLANGDVVIVRRGPHDLLLVENPAAGEWRALAEKLNWAVSPKYS